MDGAKTSQGAAPGFGMTMRFAHLTVVLHEQRGNSLAWPVFGRPRLEQRNPHGKPGVSEHLDRSSLPDGTTVQIALILQLQDQCMGQH